MTPQEKGRASIERDAKEEARRERTKALLDAAQAFSTLDMPVFPVHSIREDGSCSCGRGDCQRPGKHPRTARGFKEASTNEDQIDAWWQRWPDAGVAIATGEAGLVVIDVDVKGGGAGLENWRTLVAELGPELQDTAMVRTPSGGLHAYFKAGVREISTSAGTVAPGIDVRARGGYVIAPPSRRLDEGYVWMSGHGLERLRELPEALADLLAAPSPGQPASAAQSIASGVRNATLTSLAGSMRRRGMDEDAIFAALQVVNATRCEPPLSEQEVRAVAASVASYAPADPFENLTDTGNANRLIRLYGERIRYCATQKAWYIYEGTHWRRDEVLLIEDLVKEAHRTIYEEAARCQDADMRKACVKWATRSESRATRKATVENARSDPRVAIRPEQFDVDGWLLNCPNGTLDLRTGALRDHDSKDLITRLTGAEYDPQARSELWERFLTEATGGDDELRAYLQGSAGYSCTGDTRHEVYFVLYGETNTGKSSFTEALAATLGSYAGSVSQDAFLRRSHVGGTRDSIMPLEGKRLAVCAEFDSGRRFDEPLIKQLVGGDTVTGRRIYEHEHSFTMTAKLWLHTNHLPRLADDDDASWRRIRVVPFRCAPAEPDETLKATLCDATVSGPAILAWMVSGCKAWQRTGLTTPSAVEHETRILRLEMDPMADFFEEVCVFEPGAWTSSSHLRDAYNDYVERNHVPRELQVTSGKALGGHLRRRGCSPHETEGIRGWIGIRFAGDPPQGQLFPPEASP